MTAGQEYILTHHSLSRLLQGFRLCEFVSRRTNADVVVTHPVDISRSTQPIDQMSDAPRAPAFSLALITSGAMYLSGVSECKIEHLNQLTLVYPQESS
jgi:hypothetical protein